MQVKIFTGVSGQVESELNAWLKENSVLISHTDTQITLMQNIMQVTEAHITIVVWYELEEE